MAFLTEAMQKAHSIVPYDRVNEAVIPKVWYEDPQTMINTLGLGYKTNPTSITYDTLYLMAKRNHVVGIVHKTIKSMVTNFCRRPRSQWDIGFRIRHRYLRDWELKSRHKERIDQLTQWFENCGYDYHPERPRFRRLVELMTEDRLIFAQMTAETILRRDGQLHSLWYVPAMSIRLAHQPRMVGTPWTPEEIATQPRYYQVFQERVLTTWTEDRFLWEIANPRNTLWGGYGYGMSELEQLMIAITAELWAEEYNVNNFKNGSSLKGVFNVKGNLTREKLEDYRRHWLMQAAGVHNAWKSVFVNAEGIEFIPMNLSNSEMGYEDWITFLIYLICLMYQISPETCGFPPKHRAMRMPSRTNDQYERVQQDHNKFLRPLLQTFEDIFNSPKIMGRLDPDYCFEWQGIDKKDEEKDIENRVRELQFFKTVNEHRREKGLPERVGWDIPLNAVLTGYLNQQEALAQQKDQNEQQKALQAGSGEEPIRGHTAVTSQQEMSAADSQTGQKEGPESTEKSLLWTQEEVDNYVADLEDEWAQQNTKLF